MPADLNQEGVYFDIEVPYGISDADTFILCKCCSPQSAAATVMALMASDKEKPRWVKVVTRKELSS